MNQKQFTISLPEISSNVDQQTRWKI